MKVEFYSADANGTPKRAVRLTAEDATEADLLSRLGNYWTAAPTGAVVNLSDAVNADGSGRRLNWVLEIIEA